MVEYGSPKPGVVGSSPTAPAMKDKYNMINPFRFIQSVKQEAFKVSWPGKKETLTGAAMVVLLAIIAAVFFLLLDQLLNFLLRIVLSIGF